MAAGSVVVGQSGGPTAAINASLAGVFVEATRLGMQVWGMSYGIEGMLQGNLIDLTAALPTPMDVELLRHTPSSALGSCRLKLDDPDQNTAQFEQIFEHLAAVDARIVVYIGGNDSMDTIEKLARYGASVKSPIRFVGVPKTVDNDLVEMDHTPGFGSAAKFVATTVCEVALDTAVYDKKSAIVVEVMGRDAGWLAASSALAGEPGKGGPDIILMPEAPIDLDAFVARVDEVACRQNVVMIVASEGAQNASGELFYDKDVELDAFGHAAFQSGVGTFLAEVIKDRLGIKSRSVELSTLQRSAAHLASVTDLCEAEALGRVSVQAAAGGASGVVSRLTRAEEGPYTPVYSTVPIARVANLVRRVPRAWITPDGMGVTHELLEYCRPLIQGEITPPMMAGVPWHLRFARK